MGGYLVAHDDCNNPPRIQRYHHSIGATILVAFTTSHREQRNVIRNWNLSGPYSRASVTEPGWPIATCSKKTSSTHIGLGRHEAAANNFPHGL